jgi:hypothetical protein
MPPLRQNNHPDGEVERVEFLAQEMLLVRQQASEQSLLQLLHGEEAIHVRHDKRDAPDGAREFRPLAATAHGTAARRMPLRTAGETGRWKQQQITNPKTLNP